MNREELATFCDGNGIDWMECTAQNEHGLGFLFHWNNPNNPDDGECLHIKNELLETLSPEQLLRSVINGRDVTHMTRIVGYFSRTENWNRSKLGELKDRQIGNYKIESAEASV